ncbi:Uncharacterised protein [uncultured archaeon]|nr:Uncharacterised protein [uncultured archaeon]
MGYYTESKIRWHGFGNLKQLWFVFSICTLIFLITITSTHGAQVTKIHDNITGNFTDPECSGCHLAKQTKPLLKSTAAPLINIKSFPANNFTAILSVGQTPYQLGPFFRGGYNGWSWLDTDGYGNEKQKNLISLMVLDNSTGTVKPATGLTSLPAWPQASYRNHSGTYSYKADTASSPITTQKNYVDNIDLWMIKVIDLSVVTGANLTFWTWYSM